jgi:hypothetical protein
MTDFLIGTGEKTRLVGGRLGAYDRHGRSKPERACTGITGDKGARLIFDPIVNGMLETLADAASVDGIAFMYGSLGASGALGLTPATISLLSTLGKQIRFWGFQWLRACRIA